MQPHYFYRRKGTTCIEYYDILCTLLIRHFTMNPEQGVYTKSRFSLRHKCKLTFGFGIGF